MILTPAPAATLLTFEVWSNADAFAARFEAAFGAPPPSPLRSADYGKTRILWTEPNVWIAVVSPAEAPALAERLTAALAEDGALTEVTGAYARLTITGPGWRELLTVGAMFDAEDPAFAPGCAVATVYDHAPVRLDVVGPDTVIAWTAPSYSQGLFSFWREAAWRL